MKTEKSVSKAAKAAIQRAGKLSLALDTSISVLECEYNDHATVQRQMPKIRKYLSELTQRIHEFSAYSNCHLTD